MKILFNRKFFEHNIDSEAEGAYRIEGFRDVPDTMADGEEYMSLVHTTKYIEWIKEASQYGDYVAEVRLTPESWQAARIAVGLTILASQQNDFAVVRPPGHHSGKERAAGFCLFNNIAIASQKLVNEGKRVCIFDFDGHHGDGTQAIFYDSPDVLYISTHQHYAYPFTGFVDEKGAEKGEGYTVNFPLIPGSGDKEFLEAVDKTIQIARDFKPDVIGISAGFDAYIADRLLNLQFSNRVYYECGFRFGRAFKNIFAVLEGGYHFEIRDLVDRFIEGVNKGQLPPKIRYNEDMAIG